MTHVSMIQMNKREKIRKKEEIEKFKIAWNCESSI